MAYVSFDRGRRWQRANTDTTDSGDVADPECAFGNAGELFFVSLWNVEERYGANSGLYDTWLEDGTKRVRMSISKSLDGGKTWNAPTGFGWVDRESILIDRTNGPYRGRIYIHGNNTGISNPFLWLVYSADGGRTFTRSARTPIDSAGWFQAGAGTILPDGTLLLAYRSGEQATAGGETIGIATSVDGGSSLSGLVTAATSVRTCHIAVEMASDHSDGPFGGRAYVMWMQRVDDNELPVERDTFTRCVPMITYSDDGGKTWALPIQVGDQPPSGFPLGDVRRDAAADDAADIVVNRDGVVGAQWYDRRHDPSRSSTRLRFSASIDGGETWLPSVVVFDSDWTDVGARDALPVAWGTGGSGPPSGLGRDQLITRVDPMGRPRAPHYVGMTADASGTFHGFWLSNRGRAEMPTQLFTAPVKVEGKPTRNGSKEVAGLEEVTSRLRLLYTSTEWNDETGELTLAYTLVNTSSDTLRAPLKMRLLRLESDLGYVMPTGAEPGSGAVIDLTGGMHNGRLTPGQRLSSQDLRLSIVPVKDSVKPRVSIANLTAKVYGVLPK